MSQNNLPAIRRLAEAFERLGEKHVDCKIAIGLFRNRFNVIQYLHHLQSECHERQLAQSHLNGVTLHWEAIYYCTPSTLEMNPKQWIKAFYMYGPFDEVKLLLRKVEEAAAHIVAPEVLSKIPREDRTPFDGCAELLRLLVESLIPLNTAILIRNGEEFKILELALNPFSACAEFFYAYLDQHAPTPTRDADSDTRNKVVDGPQDPHLFNWNGKSTELAPIPWKVANYLWSKPNRTADRLELYEEVWKDSDNADGGLRAARTKFNKLMLKANIPWEISLVSNLASLRNIGPK